MNGSEEFREGEKLGELKGQLMEKLRGLEEGQRSIVISLEGFKERIGSRVGMTENDISALKGKMEIVVTIGRWVLAPVFSTLGVGIVAIMGWYLFHK